MFRVSFTGYRPEKLPFSGEDDPLCINLKKRLTAQIEKLIKDGANEFCTGMALGVDTWAAEAVLRLRETYPHIRLIALIPCLDQPSRWSAEHQSRYRDIISQCDQKVTLSVKYTKTCMHKRNIALVDLCDVLVAVYDGKSGGTMQTVNYAKSSGKETIIIAPV